MWKRVWGRKTEHKKTSSIEYSKISPQGTWFQTELNWILDLFLAWIYLMDQTKEDQTWEQEKHWISGSRKCWEIMFCHDDHLEDVVHVSLLSEMLAA